MFSPFVCGIWTDWPETFCEVDSIWYDAIAFGSRERSTPANSSIRPIVSSVSMVRYWRLVWSRAVATLGENGPRLSRLATVRRRKSCCREIRPKSEVPSDFHSPSTKYW